jgi:hypothetical protein
MIDLNLNIFTDRYILDEQNIITAKDIFAKKPDIKKLQIRYTKSNKALKYNKQRAIRHQIYKLYLNQKKKKSC